MDIKRKEFKNLSKNEKREILLLAMQSLFFYEEYIKMAKELEKKIVAKVKDPRIFKK